ncbi:MAG: UxaA family hydrolase, partial [Spirochaetaceae bacterium]|nr:UxaA family hydrolase [Spirochaetaceae bacterium]
MKPILIKVDPSDNVAIVGTAGGLEAGTTFPDGFALVDRVQEGHKVALRAIGRGEPILRYGQVIGRAVAPIARGEWIDESRVEMPQAPGLDDLPLATAVPARRQPLEGFSFQGYRNPDGSAGTKNLLGINASVQCVAGVVDVVVRRLKEEVLPKYPNVEGIVALEHNYGCGVAIEAPEAVVPIRTLQNLALHPNLGGELFVVGLGCEKLPPGRLARESASADIVSLQDRRGFADMTSELMRRAEEHLKRLDARRRTVCPASDLVVGLQCGGSDALSGVTANPAVGFAADLLVRAGGTVLFSEVTEVRDAIHLLTPR